MVLEKTFESPLDCEEIHPKGDQSWVFIGRTDAEAETPVLWPADGKKLTRLKSPDAESRRRRGRQMMRWLDGITDSMDLSMSKLHQMEKDRAVWYAAVRWVARGQTQLSD